MAHNINGAGQPTGVQLALTEIRDLQRNHPFTTTTFYIFSNMSWLCGGVFYNDEPPIWSVWCIEVPPASAGQPFFIYGADSQIHPNGYQWVKKLIRDGKIKLW